MHRFLNVFYSLFFFFSLVQASAENRDITQIFGGEEQNLVVYFSFERPATYDRLAHISDLVSIDKIEGSTVYAYANQQELLLFLQEQIPFSLHPYPQSTIVPEMSDFTDFMVDSRDIITEYPSYQGYIELLNKFAQQYPELCKTEEIGKSVKQKRIVALRVTDNVNDIEKEPRIFISCAIHGDEMNGTMIMFNMVNFLLSQYRSNSRVRNIIDNIDLWFAPFCNPDGTYYRSETSVSTARRANANGVDLNRDFPNVGIYNDKRPQQETNVLTQWEKGKAFDLGLDYHDGMKAIVCHWSSKTSRPADWKWMELTGKKYANTTGIQFGQAAVDWYPASGTRMDWQPYHNFCKGYTVEVGSKGVQSANTITSHYNRHKTALIDFFEMSLNNGIQGTITDAKTGKGIGKVKVYIKNYDKDNSWCYSHEPTGAYFRYIEAGTYDVEFSKSGYPSVNKTVTVTNGSAAKLDIEMGDGTDMIAQKPLSAKPSFSVTNHGVAFSFGATQKPFTAAIYNARGSLIETRNITSTHDNTTILFNRITANGLYFIRIHCANESIQHAFTVTR